MKKIFTFLFTLSLFACSSNPEENNKNGFSPDGGKFEIGSQSSVDIVSEFNDAYLRGDSKDMRLLISDTVVASWADGEVIKGSDSLINWLEDFLIPFSDTSEFKAKYIFSVSSENDSLGDWVNVGYEYYLNDTSMKGGSLRDWYYVINNKISIWNSSYRPTDKSIRSL